jgi:hypothetical protein
MATFFLLQLVNLPTPGDGMEKSAQAEREKEQQEIQSLTGDYAAVFYALQEFMHVRHYCHLLSLSLSPLSVNSLRMDIYLYVCVRGILSRTDSEERPIGDSRCASPPAYLSSTRRMLCRSFSLSVFL